jgi:hypothetical protein
MRARPLLLAAIALLYGISIPWYRGEEAAATDLFGVPGWVGVALICYVAATFLCAWVWMLTDVHDDPPEPPDDE